MQQLIITRMMANTPYSIRLTTEELEQAYRIKQKEYLYEDFRNALADASQNPACRFHTGHLDEFPELVTWLCEHFDHFTDANIAHNELIVLTLNHLYRASLTPEFFVSLARISPAVCCGVEKSVVQCEQNCSRYFRCENIASADDRSKHWELLSSLLSMHKTGNCSCKSSKCVPCVAQRYLSGELDISSFFHACENEQ